MVGGQALGGAEAAAAVAAAPPPRPKPVKVAEAPALPPDEDEDEGMWEANPTPPPPSPVPAAIPKADQAGEASQDYEDEGDGEDDPLARDFPKDPVREALDAGAKLKKAVLEAIGRSSPLLGTGLQASLPWQLEDGRLVIPFRNGIEENVVKGELPILSQIVTKVAGQSLKVEFRVATERKAGGPGAAETGGVEDSADIVAKVFRGQKMQPKMSGGSDGF
jgi:hypothetical protein